MLPPLLPTVTVSLALADPAELVAVAVKVVVAVTLPVTACVVWPAANPPAQLQVIPEPAEQFAVSVTEPPPAGKDPLGDWVTEQPDGVTGGVFVHVTLNVGDSGPSPAPLVPLTL